ncbi:MAG TPA: MFS transporter [Acidobacteriaceae bacterium]|jgi:MFS family permease
MTIGTSRVGVTVDSPLALDARHRAARRLLPFLFLLYIANFLDRTSIAYAAIGMSRDLGFSDRVFGLGVGVFFIGYLALQIPGALLVERWSARRTISASMVAWGFFTALTAMVRTPMELYGARFLLGVAEASFFPGVVVYLSHWFVRKDRAKAVSRYMAAVPLSQLMGSPIAGWVVGHRWLGVEGWRWLFVVEGLPAVVLGVVTWFYLTDWPRDAAWLSGEQQEWIAGELEAEKPAGSAVTILETLRSGKVLMLAGVAFLAYLPSYATIFWMPTLLKRLSGLSDTRVGLLMAIPFSVALIGMLVNGWHSDRYLERNWHAAVPVLLLGLGVLGLVVLPPSVPTILVLFCLLALELAFLPVFWAIPTEVLSAAAAAAAVGVISTIANTAGFFGPVLFGYMNTRTGSLHAGYAMLIASAAASGGLMLMVPGMRRAAAGEVAESAVSAEG